MPRLLEHTSLEGPAGRLEALHEAPDDSVKIDRVAVFCHPHPLHGGTMHNKVVFRMAKAGRRAAAAVLRFNFRGVGQSQGEYDEGRGEQDDVRTAVAYAKDRYPGLPLVLGGFSFGSSMSAKVACSDPGVERWIGAGFPVDRASFGFMRNCATPTFFVHSTNDEFGSRERMEEVFASTPDPKGLEWIEAADHFFAGKLDEFEDAVYRSIVAPI